MKPTVSDPRMLARQQIYLRALIALGVDVHYGQFKMRAKPWYLDLQFVQKPAASGLAILNAKLEIRKYDEKGSDVNLASYLIRDAAKGDCDAAIVISNDSDLAEAIRIAQVDFGVSVYVINPHKRVANELKKVATELRDLMASAVTKSQLAGHGV